MDETLRWLQDHGTRDELENYMYRKMIEEQQKYKQEHPVRSILNFPSKEFRMKKTI